MFKRALGCSGIHVSALDLGCWTVGKPSQSPGSKPLPKLKKMQLRRVLIPWMTGNWGK